MDHDFILGSVVSSIYLLLTLLFWFFTSNLFFLIFIYFLFIWFVIAFLRFSLTVVYIFYHLGVDEEAHLDTDGFLG